jgi:hypothetical protein
MPSYCAEMMENNTLKTVQSPTNSVCCSVQNMAVPDLLYWWHFLFYGITASFLSLCQESGPTKSLRLLLRYNRRLLS